MKALAALILLVPTYAIAAPAYLPQSSMQAAIDRSISESVAMGVTDGAPWWGQAAIPAGGFPAAPEMENGKQTGCAGGIYLVIEDAIRSPGYDFTANPVNPKTGQATGLSPAEKATLVPYATLSAAGCFSTSGD